ncbi:TetR/AcrR family transcriptional regulator [Corynebacterium uropygiale]|uniref:TetR/AcrR family transcriptional regulator n=1 Tax=Corynebacterium uropygiale TaxID=1775911 RepID=A0A9X1QSI2_9CORY|nr:TetR/AcrR family transcriptional regulator [Corynebacterium uropygiale]MCF4007577.1 TetR/AcrR family transcriptional regulator [Corynebacterium uropygiale]
MDNFTLTGVAKDLGVSTPSLYRLIRSRSDLVDLCLHHLARQFPHKKPSVSEKEPDSPRWRALLWGYVDDFWDLMQQHPGLGISIATHPGAHAHAQPYIHALSQELIEAGFPGNPKQVDFVIDYIGDLVITTDIFITSMRAHYDNGDRGIDVARRRLSEQAQMTGQNTHIPATESWVARGGLDAKVTYLLNSIEAGIPLPEMED